MAPRTCVPGSQSVLYPTPCNCALYLYIFRREPAISGFDWYFTAYHKSSPVFATTVGSALPTRFLEGSACSWQDHPVSGLIQSPCPMRSIGAISFRLSAISKKPNADGCKRQFLPRAECSSASHWLSRY